MTQLKFGPAPESRPRDVLLGGERQNHSRLGATLKLASLGLACFPVAPDCRRPLTAHGCKDAGKAPDALRRLWANHPVANVAVACGAISAAFVVDVDHHGDGPNGLRTLAELEAAHSALPASWRTITPGGGLHIWFRQPEGRALRNRVGFRPGLDVRAHGGSVAVPPSVRDGKPHRWATAPWDCELAQAPAWLLDLIDPPPIPRPPRPPIRARRRDALASYVAAAVEGEAREVAHMAPNTGRNLRLFRAAAQLGELVGAGLCPEAVVIEALEDAANTCGLTAEDGARAVLATIKSGLARGVLQPRQVRP